MNTKNEMKRQALCIASVASNLDNFNRNNVEILQELGYEVTLAANFHSSEDINSQEKIDSFAKEMRAKKVHIVHIDFARSFQKVDMQIKSILQVRKLLKRNFDLIHCHSPICAAIVRVEAERYRKKYGTKVFYTAHGFHFFTGAPMKNWIVYYPIEKMCSRWTDVLITINKEDYRRAKGKLHAKKTVYIPGVGVDTEKYIVCKADRKARRREFGVKPDDFLLLSVGELNDNKNHQIIIKALNLIKDEKIKYVIVGKGTLQEDLSVLAERLGVRSNVIITGYKTEIKELLWMSDCFVFPSKREGLGIAAIEAMSAGLPLITSKAGGIKDYSIDGVTGYNCDAEDAEGFAKSIMKLKEIWHSEDVHLDEYNLFSKNAYNISKKFDKELSNKCMKKIYKMAMS